MNIPLSKVNTDLNEYEISVFPAYSLDYSLKNMVNFYWDDGELKVHWKILSMNPYS